MTEQKVYSKILYAKSAGVATLTLNRPEVLNAIDEEMGKEIRNVLKDIERDSEVRSIIVTGSGRAFSAGEDIQALRSQYEREEDPALGDRLRTKYNPIISKIREIAKPFIAAVNGAAAGAGASIAYSCDLRIASDRASFIQAFIRVGLAPDSGSSYFLPRLVGMAKAMEMSLLGEPIGAEEAAKIGLVNKVVPADQLLQAAGEWAAKLAQGPAQAIGLTKRALNRSAFAQLQDGLEYEAYLQAIAARTQDHREAVRAFLEKRQPKFTGS